MKHRTKSQVKHKLYRKNQGQHITNIQKTNDKTKQRKTKEEITKTTKQRTDTHKTITQS